MEILRIVSFGPILLREWNGTYFVVAPTPTAETAHLSAIAVVCGVGAHESASFRECLRHLDGDFIRLGAGTCEYHTLDIVVVGRKQSLTVANDLIVKVAIVNV